MKKEEKGIAVKKRQTMGTIERDRYTAGSL